MQQLRKREPVRLYYSASTFEAFDEVWGATICPECFTCRGELEVRRFIPVAPANLSEDELNDIRRRHHDLVRLQQRCRCEDRSADERWRIKDFNTYVELCYCCGAEAITSGSTWSVFYCEECKQRVLELNNAVGRWVIPIGRHSAMHGTVLPLNESVDDERIGRFADAMHGVFVAVDKLHEWAPSVVRDNLGELGFAPGEDVPLADFLNAAAGAHIDRERAFERLCAQFAS